eukprot:628100-Prymnesium_polylepis.1
MGGGGHTAGWRAAGSRGSRACACTWKWDRRLAVNGADGWWTNVSGRWENTGPRWRRRRAGWRVATN